MSFPEPRFSAPPRSDIIERAASTIAFTLFLGAWVIAYVGIAPADAVRHASRLDAGRVVVAEGRIAR